MTDLDLRQLLRDFLLVLLGLFPQRVELLRFGGDFGRDFFVLGRQRIERHHGFFQIGLGLLALLLLLVIQIASLPQLVFEVVQNFQLLVFAL